MRRLARAAAVAAPILALSATGASADQFIRMVSGPSGGSWYPLGAKIMQVMQDNPAVLTCGEPLANETPADIVSTAKLRKVLDATLKPDVVAVIVVLAVGGVIARLAAAAY